MLSFRKGRGGNSSVPSDSQSPPRWQSTPQSRNIVTRSASLDPNLVVTGVGVGIALGIGSPTGVSTSHIPLRTGRIFQSPPAADILAPPASENVIPDLRRLQSSRSPLPVIGGLASNIIGALTGSSPVLPVFAPFVQIGAPIVGAVGRLPTSPPPALPRMQVPVQVFGAPAQPQRSVCVDPGCETCCAKNNMTLVPKQLCCPIVNCVQHGKKFYRGPGADGFKPPELLPLRKHIQLEHSKLGLVYLGNRYLHRVFRVAYCSKTACGSIVLIQSNATRIPRDLDIDASWDTMTGSRHDCCNVVNPARRRPDPVAAPRPAAAAQQGAPNAALAPLMACRGYGDCCELCLLA